MVVQPRTTYSQIDEGTGQLLTYYDPYVAVNDEMIERANDIEEALIVNAGKLQKTYLEIAVAIEEFDRNKLYLAKSCDSFRQYMRENGAKINMSYRTAHDLIRWVREAIPILYKNNAMELLPPVSKMRMLLPTLADGEDTF